MPRWFMCLCRWSRLHNIKEYGRDQRRYAYLPERFRRGAGRVSALERGAWAVPGGASGARVRGASLAPDRREVETLEPRLLFSASPVASADVYGTTVDTAIELDGLLLNDTDADDDALSLVSVSGASNGTLGGNGSGGYTYTPNAGFTGTDSFTYTVSDGDSGTADAAGEVTLSVNATVDIGAARDTLLAGVTSLADPGSPGHLIAYGPTAFSVSNYAGADLSDSMIAAATWGSGRVVALPDHQWLELGTHGSDASTAAFYGNGIEWLADSAALSVKVVTYNHAANASWLMAQGYTNVVNATSATLAAELADADVLIGGWIGTNPPEADLDVMGDFVANQGGGLFIADYGIGYDWWWGQAAEDIPSNRLLREAGIGFVKAYPHGAPGSGGFAINRAVGQVTAEDVLALLNDSSGATEAQKAEAAAIYTMLNGLLAEDDALQAELDAVFWTRINTINPTPTTPVSDSFEKALLQREMDLLGSLPADEVTAHRTAEDVYGTIDTNAPRLANQQVTIDADTTGLIATGLYAAPGDLVTVTLPAALVGQGYSLRINNHVDNIAGHGSYARVPYNVSRSFAIDSTTVQIANAFGGHIYIDMGGQAGGTSSGLGSQQITIDGAIAAPMFVLGQTTDAQWIATIRDNPAPYAEFVSEHLAFSVPSDWIRTLDNPTQLMQYWDDAVSFMDYVAGTETLRTGPERINLDVAISVGLLHAGYPIQGPTSYGSSIVDLDRLTSGGDWGWFHELGHEIQRQTALGWGWDNPWTFGGDVEVTVNIFANAALELLAPGTGTAGWGYSAHAEAVMAAAVATINDTNAPNFDQKDPYPFYFQLADGFGWDMYRAVLSSYVDDAQDNPSALPGDNQAEKDQWLTRWSQATGYNLVDYMVNKWGLEVSQSAVDAVNAMSLPSWLPVVPDDTTQRIAHAGSLIFDPVTAGNGLDATATFVSVAATSSQGGAISLNSNGTYTYTPDADFVGIDLIDVTYQSSAGNNVTASIRIEVYQLATNPDKSQWTLVSVDSEETVGEDGAATNAFDGDTNTLWHTQWNGGSPAHPHELVIDLGGRYDLDGFTYTPRQSGTNGRIANYEFYTSNDGINWGIAVATGTFANNASAQSAAFASTAGRYIKLVALSEVNGNAWSSVAELDVSGTLAVPNINDFEIVSVDSEETVGENGAAANAFDGDPNTIWHTQWYGGSPAHPHELVLDLGARFDLDGFTYLPRQTGVNGRIANYEFYTSLDGVNWGSAVATGTFTNTADLQTVNFTNTTGQFVKLVALSEVNGNPWTTVAELGVSGVFASAGEVVPVAQADGADVILNQPAVIAVRANDFDVDRGDALTISGFTQGAHGSTTDNGDGTLTYTPDNNYFGPDSFTYTVSDSTGRSATATVSLAIGGLASQWAFDEGTGSTTADTGVNNAPGTLTNTTWTTGVHNNALAFNGQDSVVTLGTAASLSGETDFTAATWINTTDTNGGTIIQQRDAGSPGYEGQYRFRMNDNGTLNFFIYNGGQQFNLSTTQTVNDGRWHHVAAQRDGLEGRIYIDGVLAASVTGTEIKALSPAISVAIGANIRDNDDFFKGTIDDVQLHSRSMDASEVAALFQTMPNLAPIANTDRLATAVDTAAIVSALGNDSDHNAGDTLSIASFTQGTNGTVTDNGDGTLTYTPNTGFGSTNAQLDTFTYSVSDGQGGSTTADVLVTVGDVQLHTDFNTTGGTTQVTATGNHQYELNLDFTTAPTTIENLWIDWGNGQISHGTSSGGWGPDLTSTATNLWTATQQVYAPEQVQHIKAYAADINGNVYQSKVTLDATQTPVYNVTAEALSSSEVRVAWAHRFAKDVAYKVSATMDGGQTFTHLMTTALGTTFALIEGLSADMTYSYRVEPELGEAAAFEEIAEAPPLQQPQVGPNGGAQVWYRVAVETPSLQHGSASYTGSGEASVIGIRNTLADDGAGVQRTWEHVLAVSPEAAIYKAIQGSAYITATDIQQSKIFTFGKDAAFKVGTYGDLKNAINGYNIATDPGDGQYLITLEDSFRWTNIDLDFDDWYWEVLVEPAPDQTGQAVDLDVDSLNDSGFAPPAENSLMEDGAEDFQGKLVDVGRYDVDRDGIPDYADGFDLLDGSNGMGGVGGLDAISQGEQFVPILIHIDDGIDLNTATLTFTYSASDPAAVTATPVPLFPDTYLFSPGAGSLRIWTKDGGQARHKADDYIGSGAAKNVSDLPIFNGNPRILILWVEGVQANAGRQIETIAITLDDPGYTGNKSLEDSVLIELQDPEQALVDLDVDSDNLDGLGRDAAEEAVEEIGGKITALSIQDLDGNSIPDFADSHGIAGLEFTEMALELQPPVPQIEYLGDGEFTTPEQATAALLAGALITFEYDDSHPLHVSGGNHTHIFDPYTPQDGLLRIWRNNGTQARGIGDFIEAGVTYSGADLGLGTVGTGSQAETVSEIRLWVEAVSASGANVPIKVTVSYGNYTRPDGTTGGPGGTNPVTTQGEPTPPTAEYETESDIVYVRPGGVDLDIDSDNNGEYATGDLAEDVLEDVGVGKVLVTATSDRDGNGILDFTDGFGSSGSMADLSGEHLVPLDLTLPEWITSSLGSVGGDAWVVFNYAASDPAGLSGSASATSDSTTLPPGNLRLWTTADGRSPESASEATGSFINNAQKSLSQHKLGESIAKTYFESERIFLNKFTEIVDGKIRLYVEAISAPEDGQPLEIEVIFGTTFDLDNPARERDVLMGADTVRVTVVEPAAPFADGIGLNGVGDGLDGGNPLLDAFMGPVRLDGQLASLVSPELAGDPFAWAFGHNRVWSDDPVAGLGAMAGPGHMIAELPFLVHGTSTVIAVFSPTNQLYFDRIVDNPDTPDEYVARFFALDTLEFKTGNTIELTDSAGNLFTFHGYAEEGETGVVPDLQKGKLKQIKTASGHEIDFKYKDASESDPGLLEDITREIGSAVEEKLAFVYTTPIEIQARTNAFEEPDDRPILYQPSLETIKLYRVEGTEETITRSVEYDYYTGEEVPPTGEAKPGRLGDLKMATIRLHHANSSVVDIDQTYYRYEYQDDDSQAPAHSKQDLPLTRLITMDNAAIARSGLTAVQLDATTTATLIDDHGATAIRTRHHAATGFAARGLAAGSAVSHVGKGGYTLDVERHDVVGPNAARYTVTVTPSDGLEGLTETYTLNAAREVLSYSVEADLASEGAAANPQIWESKFSYDTDHRLVSASSPSDLTTVYEYFADGDVDASGNSKAGRLKAVIRQDHPQTPDPSRIETLTTFDYKTFEGFMRLESITDILDPGALTGNTTKFVYAGTKGTAQRTTILPAVGTNQHGTGSPDSITEKFDTHGNLIEFIDAKGTVHTTVYNPAALTLTEVADPGGLALTTITQFDELGNIKYIQHPDDTRTYFHIYQTESTLQITTQSGWRNTADPGQPEAYRPLGNATRIVTDLATGETITTVRAGGDLQTAGAEQFADSSQPLQGLSSYSLSTTKDTYDKGGRLIQSEVTQLAGGSQSEKPKTTYEYDGHGRLNKTHRFYSTGAGDAITNETVFDPQGRVTKFKVAGQIVQSFVYDDHGVGDSNVTSITLHPGGDAPNRVTLNIYDWRDRLVATKQGHEGGTDEANINRPASVYTYDNLDRIIETRIYDADGDVPSYDLATDEVMWEYKPPTHSGSNTGIYLQRTDYTDYDARGQVFQTRSVDPDPQANYTVTIGLWYDANGQLIKQKNPGGLTTKITYDALGRATDVYLTDDKSAGLTVGDPASGGDNVLEHTRTTYDEAGNAVYIHKVLRTAFGGTRNEAVSHYYDILGRLTTTLNHGTNIPTGDQRPEKAQLEDGGPFARNHANNTVTFLRTDYGYSTTGRTNTITDPRGIISEAFTDGFGRTILTIQAKGEDASLLGENELATNGNQDVLGIERETTFKYDGLGRVTEQQVDTPTDSAKTTTYNYSGLYLDSIHLPGHAEELAKPVAESLYQAYFRDYTHNALGEATLSPTSSGLNQYNEYDVLGRLISSEVQVGGNQSVVTSNDRRRLYEYDALGNVNKITVDDADGTPDSVVYREYNAFGQLKQERQDHDGDGTSRDYDYLYSNVNGGVRARGIEYVQAGRTFHYSYDSGLDNNISRISRVQEGPSQVAMVTLEHYQYLGLGTPEIITTGTSGTDIVQTRTFDDFSRLESQHWVQGTTTLGHFTFGYDSAGNMLYKRDARDVDLNTAGHQESSHSELFQNDGASKDTAYDALGRMQEYQRGVLSASVTNGRLDTVATSVANEDWDADTEGVYRSVEDPGQTLQKQSFVKPLFQGNWSATDFADQALEPWKTGNSTAGSPPYAVSTQFDGWGRLAIRKDWSVSWSGDDAAPTLLTTRSHWYDGLGRFIVQTFDDANDSSLDQVSRLYHDAAGNIVEDFISKNGALAHTKTALWSPVTGDLILEDFDSDNNNATVGSGLSLGNDVRYLTLVDGRGNTAAVLSGSGAVLSRYSYTPGGKIELLSGSNTNLYHLYQQGWADFKTAFAYDGTILRGGAYHDALTNGVLQMNGLAYWADQTAIEIEQISSYHRFVLDVAGGWSTGVGYVTGAFDWVATQFDTAGGWLLHNLGVAGYPGVYYTALASGVTRLAGGLVGLADVPGLIAGTYDAYHAYRDEGYGGLGAGVLSTPVLGGVIRDFGQSFTGTSLGPYDYGRTLTGTERATSIAFSVSIVGGGAAGVGRLGVAARSSRAAAVTQAPRPVSLNVLNNQFRLPGGATNPALAQRFLAYQARKAKLGVSGPLTRKQFRRFMGDHRPGSRGATLYPKNTNGFSRMRQAARGHGNRLNAPGPHDVYAIRQIGGGQLLRFGETGRGYLTRFAEHQRQFAALGIDIEVSFLGSVKGKLAAKSLETRYITAYQRIYGQRPPYNLTNH